MGITYECTICKQQWQILRMMPYGMICPVCYWVIGPGFMGGRRAEIIYKSRTKNSRFFENGKIKSKYLVHQPQERADEN